MSTSPSAPSFDGEDAMLEELRKRGAKSKSVPARAGDHARRQAMIASVRSTISLSEKSRRSSPRHIGSSPIEFSIALIVPIHD